MKSGKLILAIILGMLMVLAIIVAGCATTGTTSTSDLEKRVKTLESFKTEQQTKINPGLGTIMLEYSTRMNKLWFAGQASNWDLARFEIDEMKEIQEVGEIDRPKRAPQLKDFEKKHLDVLDSAANAKDLTKFNSAYTDAIKGCNDCHVKSKSDEFPNFTFIKVQVPTSEITGGLEIFSVK